MTFVLGIIAALAAPLTMTLGFIVWDNHWKGSAFALNMFKCNLASVGFLILSLSTRGRDLFPSDIFTLENVGFLVLSSIIGIVIGDLTWLEALGLLGARRVIVMDSLKPFLAALFGWAILGEELKLEALGGIFLTVVGILLVSLETDHNEQNDANRNDIEQTKKDKEGKQSPISMTTTPETEAVVSGRSEDNSSSGQLATLSLATGSFQQNSPKICIAIDEKPSHVNPPDVEIALMPLSTLPEDTNSEEASITLPLSNHSKRAKTRLQIQQGYFMSILNVVLDTYGSVLTKDYGQHMTTWEINLIRFGFAGIFMILCSLVFSARDWLLVDSGRRKPSNNRMVGSDQTSDNRAEECANRFTVPEELWYKLPLQTMTKNAWIHVAFGVLFVTFFTPALSNYALFQIALALALTLGSAGPLYALPLTFIMQEDQKLPTVRAWLGATLAVAGIVMLAFWGQST